MWMPQNGHGEDADCWGYLEGVKTQFKDGRGNGGRTGDLLDVPVSEEVGKISERNMNSQQKGSVYKS